MPRRYFSMRDLDKALNADVMKKSGGNVPWLKDFTGQLDDAEYVQLTMAERGLLKDLRLLAARRGNKLPDDARVLARQLRYTDRVNLTPKLRRLRDLSFTVAYAPVTVGDPKRTRRVPEEEPSAEEHPANDGKDSRVVLEAVATDSLTEQSRAEKRTTKAEEQEGNDLPFGHILATAELMQVIGKDADDGTPTQVRDLCAKLPEGSIRKVIESTRGAHVRNRAKYACGALRDERRALVST